MGLVCRIFVTAILITGWFTGAKRAHASDVLVAGTKLVIKDKNGKKKFLWVAKDPAIDAAALASFSWSGATLFVTAYTGDAGVTLTDWSQHDGPSYKYKNKQAPAGDSVCKVASIKTGSITIKCKDDLIKVADPGPHLLIAIRLEIGTSTPLSTNYCAEFDFGSMKKDEAGIVIATNGPAPSACTSGTLPAKSVFVTSVGPGNLSGLAGADALCAQRATFAGRSGTFKAWLGDHANDPTTRFPHYAGPYGTSDGLIARNWLDLLDESIDIPITRNEFGSTVGDQQVWTGTHSDGSRDGMNCIDWLSSSGAEVGTYGRTSSTDFTWANESIGLCSSSKFIYCFEQ
jgi:hypothetical protein